MQLAVGRAAWQNADAPAQRREMRQIQGLFALSGGGEAQAAFTAGMRREGRVSDKTSKIGWQKATGRLGREKTTR
jgi:hypothetical protein